MAQPYVGEIRIFAGNFNPNGWMFCEGQLLPISEYETLFNLIGTTYGGDGQSTFALPDLRGRLPIHMGTGPGLGTYTLAEAAGVEEVTLSTQQIPAHTHALLASTATATAVDLTDNILATSPTIDDYVADVASAQLAANTVSSVGGSQPHTNFQPYLCLNYIISLFGVFPSQT